MEVPLFSRYANFLSTQCRIGGQDSPWKSQSEWQRTKISGKSASMAWLTLGSRTAKEKYRTG